LGSGSAFELVFCRAARAFAIQDGLEPIQETLAPCVAAGFQPEHRGYG
jgi:hypothetical protein